MTKILFITFLLMAFYGSARVYGQDLYIGTGPIVRVQPQAAFVPVAPPTIYVPQVQMVPYQYDRTEVIRRQYATPLRDWMFGRYRINNYYRQGAGQ